MRARRHSRAPPLHTGRPRSRPMNPERLSILYVSHMPASSPRFGAQARLHGLMTQLARRHDPTAVMPVDDEEDRKQAISGPDQAAVAATVCSFQARGCNAPNPLSRGWRSRSAWHAATKLARAGHLAFGRWSRSRPSRIRRCWSIRPHMAAIPPTTAPSGFLGKRQTIPSTCSRRGTGGATHSSTAVWCMRRLLAHLPTRTSVNRGVDSTPATS